MATAVRRSADAEVFRIAVQTLQDTIGDRFVLRVDPRPMGIPDFGRFPGMADYHDGVDGMIAERLGVLAELGVDTASALPLIPDCHPLMSAPPGQRVVHGCPDERIAIALFDTMRTGNEAGTWVLRELPIYYWPGGGRAAGLTDNVIGREGGEWVVLNRIPLGIWEK